MGFRSDALLSKIRMTGWGLCTRIKATEISLEGLARLSQAGEVTELLREWGEGRPDAIDRLFDVVFRSCDRLRGHFSAASGQRTSCNPPAW